MNAELEEICVRHGFCGPFSKIPAAKALEMAAEAYSAGAEQMRERAAVVADEWSCRNAFEWARYKENIVDSIRALPVGESSRAPEGTKP